MTLSSNERCFNQFQKFNIFNLDLPDAVSLYFSGLIRVVYRVLIMVKSLRWAAVSNDNTVADGQKGFFIKSPRNKNANIVNFVLIVLLQRNLTTGSYNL